jgi:hypothetical protein
MNPVEIGTNGKSFKGLSAYLLHDANKAETAERVAWAQTFNLDEAPAERAWRLMAGTALSADQLKAAAGIKKGPRAKNTVLHFSLNFNPDDNPSEELQRKAAMSALKALGLDAYQALAVAHNDTKHRHVHLMVNLINPENGVSAASKQPDGTPSKLSNTKRKLSRWAQQFEREHGLIVTEGRIENANRRAQGEQIDARRKDRQQYEQQRHESKDRRRDYLRQGFDEQAKTIAERGRDQRERHKLEWDALRTSYKAQKDALFQTSKQEGKAAAEKIRQDSQSLWDGLFMRQKSEGQDFWRGEKSAIGKIWHGAAVVKSRAKSESLLGAFVAAFSQQNRREIIDRQHKRERDQLGRKIRAQVAAEFAEISHTRKERANAARVEYLAQCALLKQQQDEERQKLRQMWQQHNLDRAAKMGRENIRRHQLQQDRERAQGFKQGLQIEPF